MHVGRARTSLGFILVAAVLYGVPAGASAERMDLALSRLRVAAEDPAINPATTCPTSFTGSGGDVLVRSFCPDEDAWRSLVTQFAGALAPPILLPAHTRGMRGLYVGLESWITGIESGRDYWARGTEGDELTTERNRFVDSVLVWNRLNVRKGLPFGFEIGTNVGFAVNTSYWTLGLEVRWSLIEGLRDRNSAVYFPSLSVRGSVQTLVGDSELNVTVPALDVTLGERFIIGNAVEFSPYVGGQVLWIFGDTELVDLTPDVDALRACDPNPYPPGHPMGPQPDAMGNWPRAPYCRGDGSDLNHNVVFPRIRSMRARGFLGLQLRYEWFALTGAFAVDIFAPRDLDDSIPTDAPRQWQAQVGVGVSY
jgi:hypothetical protein